jgi:Zn-dependent protease with chaperone function
MEAVKHEYLKDEHGKKLLDRLEAIIAVLISDKDTANTIRNYHTEMILSCVLVSKDQYNQVHLIVEEAKRALISLFGEDASENVKDVEVYVKRCEVPDACSYALPGKPGHPPIIVINSSLIELMNDNELQAVILHELGHLLYTSSEYMQAMKIMLDILSDGTIVRTALAEFEVQHFNQLSVGFELTADRVMKLCMPDEWADIRTMFVKYAGGVNNMAVNADAFVRQLDTLDPGLLLQTVMISQKKQEHPPILYRLKLLQDYKYDQRMSS